jgi:hypothetical protein
MATKQDRLQSDIQYCSDCYQWICGTEAWETHCQGHLQNLRSTRCGTVTYCHTLVLPGRCPFCVGNTSLLASQRLQTWSRDHDLWMHVIEEHLRVQCWPLSCPYPLCDISITDNTQLYCHFVDNHSLSRTRPATNKGGTRQASLTGLPLEPQPRGRKRKAPDDENPLVWIPPIESPLDSRSNQSRQADPPGTCFPPLLDAAVKREQESSIVSPTNLVLQQPVVSAPLDLGSGSSSADALEQIQLFEPSNLFDVATDDSTSFDDSIFSQFLCSPSLTPPPSSPSLLDQDNCLDVAEEDQEVMFTPSASAASPSDNDGQDSRKHEETPPPTTQPRIRLVVKVPQPQTKPKLILRMNCQKADTRFQHTKKQAPRWVGLQEKE